MKTYKNFVNGKLVASVDGEDEPIISPVDEKVLGKVPKGTAKDVDRAVNAAAAAFEKWQDSTPQDRSLMLLKLADRIEQNADELASLEADNVGKPIGLAKAEIPFLVDNLRFFAGACRCMEGKAAGEYLAGYTSIIRREPVGVVGIDRAVELPADDGDLEDRPGAGGGQHGRPEAVRADAADDDPPRGAVGGHLPARSLQRRSRATASRSARRS
jgi:acyl-CoA reductase-like NAD-dependent aldehyde dehydrogenase